MVSSNFNFPFISSRLAGILLILLIGLDLSGVSRVNAASIDGTLDWSRRVELSTTVSGKVVSVLVKVGSLVRKNQVLVSLDPVSFNANLKLANAEKSKAQHVYKEAKKELERHKELYERTVISTHDLELAKIEHTKSLSNYRQAQAKVSLARLNKEESVLRAPFSSVVVAVHVEKGTVITTQLQAKPMLVLAEQGKMKVTANIKLSVLRSLKSGQSVQVLVNGTQFNGKISELGFEPVNNSGNPEYRLVVMFSLPTGTILRSGQRATIKY